MQTRGLLRLTRVSLILYAAAITADCLTTWLVLNNGGREGNPLMKFVFHYVGPYIGMGVSSLAKVLILLPVFWIMNTHDERIAWAFPFVVVGAAIAPVHNLMVL